MSFMLDTAGDQQLLSAKTQPHIVLYSDASKNESRCLLEKKDDAEKNSSNDEQDDEAQSSLEFFGLKLQSKDLSKIVAGAQTTTKEAPSRVTMEMDAIKGKVDEASSHKPQKLKRFPKLDISRSDDLNLRKENVEKDMRRVPGFEQIKTLPRLSNRKQRVLNRMEREKTKGSGWFDLPATEVTDEMRNELKIIQMRSVLDPKHFYKKNDLKVLPKYFQIGTVQHSPLDHYSERHTRKTKKSLVDELLEDADFQAFNKRKYNEVLQRTNKYAHRKALKKMKQLKKKK